MEAPFFFFFFFFFFKKKKKKKKKKISSLSGGSAVRIPDPEENGQVDKARCRRSYFQATMRMRVNLWASFQSN